MCFIGATTFYYHLHNQHNHYNQNPSMVGLRHDGMCDDDDGDDDDDDEDDDEGAVHLVAALTQVWSGGKGFCGYNQPNAVKNSGFSWR